MNPLKMTNLHSHALEYAGYYAQRREKKSTLKEPETAQKIWEEFLCQSLMGVIRERMSQAIFKN